MSPAWQGSHSRHTDANLLFNFANATEATRLEVEMLAAGFMSKTDSSLFSVWPELSL